MGYTPLNASADAGGEQRHNKCDYDDSIRNDLTLFTIHNKFIRLLNEQLVTLLY